MLDKKIQKQWNEPQPRMDSLWGWFWWDSTLIDIKSPASAARHPVHRGNEAASASVRVICEINFPETSHLYFGMEGGFPFLSIQYIVKLLNKPERFSAN